MSEWNCIASLAGHNCYSQVTLAVNEAVITTENDSGYWKAHAYMTTATVPLAGINPNNVFWTIAITMIPIQMGGKTGLQTASNLGDVIPSTISAFSPWAIETPLADLSTVTASTFQVIADTNLSLNASVGFPTFLGTGNVSVNALSNIDLEAGYDLIGNASHIVNLTATNEIDLTASTINLYANVNRLLSSTDVAQPVIQYGAGNRNRSILAL
jgi:hypothetical protein